MYELIQNLIAFKYAAKMKHWKTDNYSLHLLYDKMETGVDDFVDEIAERYFMANDNKDVFKSNILNQKLIQNDLCKMIDIIISHIEQLIKEEDCNEGIISLLTEIESNFLNKLALIKLK